MKERPDDLCYILGNGPCFIGALDLMEAGRNDVWEEGLSLGNWLDQQGFPRRTMKEVFKSGLVLVNGKKATAQTVIRGGQELRIRPPKEHVDHDPIDLALPVLYEDEDLVIFHKPVGLTMNSSGQVSMANGVAHYFKVAGLQRKVRFISRLDRDTEGCVAVAKHPLSQSFYQHQMEQHLYQKWYLAKVEGLVDVSSWAGKPYVELLRELPDSLRVTGAADLKDTDVENEYRGALLTFPLGLGEDGVHRQVMEGGKATATYVEVLSRDDAKGETTLRIGLLSGKTHQIRVSLAALGHPLVHDVLYGAQGDGTTPFILQAFEVSFQSLRTGRRETVRLP